MSKTALDAVNSALESLNPSEDKNESTESNDTGREGGNAGAAGGNQGSDDSSANQGSAVRADGQPATDGASKDASEESGAEHSGGKPTEGKTSGADTGKPANADGTGAKSDKNAPADGGKPVADAGKPATDGGKPKPIDPVNDPIPTTVAPRTKERIEKLIGITKEQQGVVDQFNELTGVITGTGASPEEFSAMLGYMKLVHSNSVADQRQAYNIISAELTNLAKRLGEQAPGQNPFDGHTDLIEEVQGGTLTEARALEIAVSRNRHKAEQTFTSEQNQGAEARQQWEARRDAAKTELNDLGGILQTSDPLYAQKWAAIKDSLIAQLPNVDPAQWKSAFLTAYKAAKVTAPAAAVTTPASTATATQPMRANKQPAGQGSRKPGNMHEAIWGS